MGTASALPKAADITIGVLRAAAVAAYEALAAGDISEAAAILNSTLEDGAGCVWPGVWAPALITDLPPRPNNEVAARRVAERYGKRSACRAA